MGVGLPTARRRPSFPPVSPLTSFSLSNLEWNGVKEKEEKEGEQQRPAAFVAAQEKGVDRKKRETRGEREKRPSSFLEKSKTVVRIGQS